jgi:hypothetical protein
MPFYPRNINIVCRDWKSMALTTVVCFMFLLVVCFAVREFCFLYCEEGGQCAGNQCGPECGIREPGANGEAAVTLPGWFYKHGFFTAGAGKIFHEGAMTENQDYAHSWTPSTTNPRTGLFEAPTTHHAKFNGTPASPTWYAEDAHPLTHCPQIPPILLRVTSCRSRLPCVP